MCSGLSPRARTAQENDVVPVRGSPRLTRGAHCVRYDFWDPASAAVSPSVAVAEGNNALSAVGLMPPCGVRDPAVLVVVTNT